MEPEVHVEASKSPDLLDQALAGSVWPPPPVADAAAPEPLRVPFSNEQVLRAAIGKTTLYGLAFGMSFGALIWGIGALFGAVLGPLGGLPLGLLFGRKLQADYYPMTAEKVGSLNRYMRIAGAIGAPTFSGIVPLVVLTLYSLLTGGDWNPPDLSGRLIYARLLIYAIPLSLAALAGYLAGGLFANWYCGAWGLLPDAKRGKLPATRLW